MHSFWRRLVVLLLMGGSVAGCAARTHKAEASASGVKASGVAVAEAAAIEAVSIEAVSPHAVVPPNAIKWVPFPLGGPGVRAAVLSGDVDKPGPFVLRIKSPAGSKVLPHWHPSDEHLTVISGTFALGMGDVFDPKKMQTIPAGGYALLPREMHHFALSKTATVVQVHGHGPFQVNFVNPADDPRKKSAAP
jgi:hypothetical protein